MMVRWAFKALAIVAGCVSACAAERPASRTLQDICGVRGATTPDIRKAVLKTKGVAFHENLGEYETFIDERNRRLWTFTQKDSKLPPSAICRTVVPKGSGSEVKMEIVCYGETNQCTALRDDWKAFLSSQLPAVQQ